MFDRLRKAWQEAVDNFWRELASEESTDKVSEYPFTRPTQRDRAPSSLHPLSELIDQIEHLESKIEAELHEEARCRRIAELAAEIGDAETLRIATDYAAHHSASAAQLRNQLAELTTKYESLTSQYARD